MYKQFAKGNFSVPVTGPWHCGPDHTSPKQFDYEVEVNWNKRKPDYRGFFVDNTDFAAFFNGLSSQPLEVSCEHLAKQLAEDIHTKMTGGKAKEVMVRIWAIPNSAMIEYRYTGRGRFPLLETMGLIGILGDLARILGR